MSVCRFGQTLLLLGLLAGCTAGPVLPPVTIYEAPELAALQYKAVLVAGDGGLPVFDNAVAGVAARMQSGLVASGMQRLSAAPSVVANSSTRSATLDHVLDAIGAMHPGAGQGCFVFATSHGAAYRGLLVGGAREVLRPDLLDAALARGCGNAPTVVVISGCYTGRFTEAPMARDNRVILTASRFDRASFGCGAGRVYTVYDRCLLRAMDNGGSWKSVNTTVQLCVAAAERQARLVPSEPQASFGIAVAGLSVPGGRGSAR